MIHTVLMIIILAAHAELRTAPAFWSAGTATEFNVPTGLHIYDLKANPIAHTVVGAESWNAQKDARFKNAFLMELWHASRLEKQNEKRIACYSGDPEKLYEKFFASDPDVLMSVSPDRRMIGLEKVFKAEDGGKRYLHMRLHACHMLVTAPGDRTVGSAQSGFASGVPQTLLLQDLPETLPKEDGYDRAVQGQGLKHDQPWQGVGDIRQEPNALRLAVILQKYFYEGMADQNLQTPDENFVIKSNTVRTWCNMPWENVGPQQREAVHGFITGRPLAKSRVYPRAQAASNWGTAFFNEQGCQALAAVFGSSTQRVAKPSWQGFRFPPGTVIVKLHFTESDFIDLKGALQVSAQINSPYSVTSGGKQTVRHYQMDIAIKDPSLLGAKMENNHWVMLSYYFDKDFTQSDAQFARFLSPLKHIRAMGIQYGFHSNESVIFAGSKTVSEAGFLTGPADSPRASCLSCHATAGTNIFLVPGLNKYSDQLNLHAAKGLDYSLSLQHAINLYSTRPQNSF